MAEELYLPPLVIHGTVMAYRILAPLGDPTNRARHFLAEALENRPTLGLKRGDRVFVKEWLAAMLVEGSEPRGQVERAERVYRTVGAARLEGLVGALDIFPWNGRRYVVTRYIEGAQDPASWCNQARSKLERQQRIAYLLREQVRRVFALHALGAVHRDLNWLNWLIDREHRVYLIDFTEAVPLNPEGEEYARIAGGEGHQAPGFDPTECRERGEPHGPAGDVWQVGAMGFALATGMSFDRYPWARARYRSLIPGDLEGGLQDFLSRALNPDPGARFTSAEEPERLLSGIACRPGTVPFARLLRQMVMDLERSLVRYYQDFLPTRTWLGLFTAVIALASLGETAGGEAQRWVQHLLGSPVAGEAAWGALVAGAVGLGAAAEPLWRLNGRAALATALRAGPLAALGGLAGMAAASLLLYRTLDGRIPGLVVDDQLLPALHLLAWMVYGAGSGLGFGAGLLWARWLGIGRAALAGGTMGGMAGGALFVAFSRGTIPGVLDMGALEAARYSSAVALAGTLALFIAFTHRRAVREIRLKAWAKGCPAEIALPSGEPVTIGRSVGPFYLSSELADHVPARFLEILRDDAGLRLSVLAPGRGLLNNRPLEEGATYRLQVGDWLDIGRRSVFRIESGECKG